MRYNVRDHWWQCGVREERNVDSAMFGHTVSFGRMYIVEGKRILQIDKLLPVSIPRIRADVVILSANNRNSIDDIRRKIDLKELVFDTSNSPSHIKHWIEECEKWKLRYYDCRVKAFEMEL